MKVEILENVYYMRRYVMRLMYGAEIWGFEDGWKVIDAIQGKFCRKVL
jgi:hypothetical protein